MCLSSYPTFYKDTGRVWASLLAQSAKNPPAGGQQTAYNEGNTGLIPGSGISLGAGNVFLIGEFYGQRSQVGYVQGVTKSQT